LLVNDVQVEQASQSFTLDGVQYPAGTYVVWLDQPKRGLANVILEAGLDLSDIPGLFFYSPPSVWSHPLLWGTYRAVMEEKINIQTHPVNKADAPQGSAEGGKAGAYVYLPTSLTAVQATNDLLARGVELFRATDSFTDGGRTFGPGAIIVPADRALANELANGYALDVLALKNPPGTAVPMHPQRIAVYGDEGVRHSLETLGFDYDELSRSDLNAGAIADYDVFVNQDLRWSSIDAAGQTSVSDWFAAGGNYVALTSRGVGFAAGADFVDVTYASIPGNSIVKIDFNTASSLAAGFREEDYAFVNSSIWFTSWDDLEVATSIDGSNDFLVSGFWPDWQTSGAAGMPIVLQKDAGNTDVTLIGLDATFRGHPENMFRLIANAIYDGLD
jgi:hypothetical protein